MSFPDASVGTGKALGVSMSVADIDGGTIANATIEDATMSGTAISGGSTLAQTSLTTTSASTVGFYGVSAATQPANAAQAALTVVTATVCGYGFPNATAFNSFIAQLENIRASLVLLGLLKGGA